MTESPRTIPTHTRLPTGSSPEFPQDLDNFLGCFTMSCTILIAEFIFSEFASSTSNSPQEEGTSTHEAGSIFFAHLHLDQKGAQMLFDINHGAGAAGAGGGGEKGPQQMR